MRWKQIITNAHEPQNSYHCLHRDIRRASQGNLRPNPKLSSSFLWPNKGPLNPPVADLRPSPFFDQVQYSLLLSPPIAEISYSSHSLPSSLLPPNNSLFSVSIRESSSEEQAVLISGRRGKLAETLD